MDKSLGLEEREGSLRHPHIKPLFLWAQGRLNRDLEITKLARKPRVPRIVRGIVRPQLRTRLIARLDLPQGAVFVHVGHNEQGAVFLDVFSCELGVGVNGVGV